MCALFLCGAETLTQLPKFNRALCQKAMAPLSRERTCLLRITKKKDEMEDGDKNDRKGGGIGDAEKGVEEEMEKVFKNENEEMKIAE
ncbi:hypothetical protein ElyMa_001681400 [Elysia marginata]|uniref:Uncharacterized protein n=1 Tax=Elysia marginata TaxID=1093978 RepID=A0AAV4JSA1_9GAST|nr:hypothetical protein ElyMa_001681400 [Elysia marginata]